MANNWVNNHLAVTGPPAVVKDFVACTAGPRAEFELIRVALPPPYLTLDNRLRWQLLFWNTCWFTIGVKVVHESSQVGFNFGTANMPPLQLVRTAARRWPEADFTISYICEEANFSGQTASQGIQTVIARTGTYTDLCDFLSADQCGPRLQPRAPLSEAVRRLSVVTDSRLDAVQQIFATSGAAGLASMLSELAAVGDYATLHRFVDDPAVSPQVAWELAVWAASGTNCANTVYALLDARDALKSAIGALFLNFCTLLVPTYVRLPGDVAPVVSRAAARDLVTIRDMLFHDFHADSFPDWLSAAQVLVREWVSGSVGDMFVTAKLLTRG